MHRRDTARLAVLAVILRCTDETAVEEHQQAQHTGARTLWVARFVMEQKEAGKGRNAVFSLFISYTVSII